MRFHSKHAFGLAAVRGSEMFLQPVDTQPFRVEKEESMQVYCDVTTDAGQFHRQTFPDGCLPTGKKTHHRTSRLPNNSCYRTERQAISVAKCGSPLTGRLRFFDHACDERLWASHLAAFKSATSSLTEATGKAAILVLEHRDRRRRGDRSFH